MMSKQNLHVYLSIIVLLFAAACSKGPNSSPGGAVVLAMDAVVHRDIQLLIKATYGSRASAANPREIGAKMNEIVKRFYVGHNAKVSIGRTFKEGNGRKATVYFSLGQHGEKQQFVMRAERIGYEWVAIIDSIAKTDKSLWY